MPEKTVRDISDVIEDWANGDGDEVVPFEASAGEIPMFSDEEIAEAESGDEEKDEEGDDGEGDGEDGEGAKPETIKIGDDEVAIEALSATYQEVRDVQAILTEAGIEAPLKEVAENGATHIGLMTEFAKGPKEALKVVNTVFSSLVAAYGKDLPADEREDFDVALLDPAQMTVSEKRLYGLVLTQQEFIGELGEQMAKVAEEGKKAIAEKTNMETANQEVELIKTQFPDATVTVKDVIELKKKHGVDSALTAYKLENYDALMAKARQTGEKEAEKVKPNLKKGGDALDIDPKNDTADQIIRKLERAGAKR